MTTGAQPRASVPVSMLHAPAAALLLAALMTLGDFAWATYRIQHRAVYGVVHGAAMCLFIGAVIGARARRPLAGALAGPFVGIMAAGCFYLLAPIMRLGAMLPAWMALWMMFAVLQRQIAAADARESGSSTGLRGLAASVMSGAAFYAISGIWTRHEPGGPNYAVHFASWCIAFLPGFLALFVGTRRRS